MPSTIPGWVPADEEDPQSFEEPSAFEPKASKTNKMKYPSVNKKPEKRPFWYNPGYWQEGTLRTRRQQAEARFGPWNAPDDPNPLYNNKAIRYKAVADNVDPHVYADYLANRYPGMSPSMLAALVASGTPATKDVVDADGVMFGSNLDSKRGTKPATTLGQGLTGLKFDYETTGSVEIDGRQVNVGEGQAVIRDKGGNAVHVFTPGVKESDKQTDSFAPYEWLKGLSRNFFGLLNMPVSGVQATFRNVAKDLSDGKPGDAALSLLEFLPPVSVVTELLDPENINPWEQTEFGQSILAVAGQRDTNGTWIPGSLAGGPGLDQGDGFFIGLDSDVGVAARDAAIDAYEVNGEAWTYGRGLAAAIDIDPDSVAYNVLSGTVDLTMAVLTDPTIWTAGLGIPSNIAKATTGGKVLFGVARRNAVQAERKYVASLHGMTKIDDEISALQKEIDNAPTPERQTELNEEILRKKADHLEYEGQLRDMGLTKDEVKAMKEEVRAADKARVALLDEQRALGEQARAATSEEHRAQILANAVMDPAYVDSLAQYTEAMSRLQQIEDRVANAVGLGPTAYPVADLSASLTTMADSLGLDQIDSVVRQLEAQGGSMFGLRTKMPPPNALKRDGLLEPTPGVYDESQQVVAYWRPQDGAYRPPNLADGSDDVPTEFIDSLSARLADPVRGPGKPERPLDEIRAEATADPAEWRVKRVENGAYEAPNGAFIRRAEDGSWEVIAPGSLEPTDIHRTLAEAKAALDDLRAAADEDAFTQGVQAATPSTLSLTTLTARLRKMGVLDTPYGQAMLQSAESQLTRVDDLLTTPGLTYQRLVDEFDRLGLLPHFDTEMKAIGLDGIKGIGRREGDDGFIWWGDNPDIDVYGARLSRMALDDEIRLTPTTIDETTGLPVGDIGLILDDAGELRTAAEATRAQVNALGQRVAEVEAKAADGRMLLSDAQAEVARLNGEIARVNAEAEALVAQQAASRMSGPEAMLARRESLMEAARRLRGDVRRNERGGVMKVKDLDTLAAKNEERLAKMSELEATREGMKRNLGAEEGAFGQRAINYDLLRQGVFGGMSQGGKTAQTAQAAVRFLAQITESDAGRVMLLTKNKFPPALIRDLVDNATLTVDQARVNGLPQMFSEEVGALGSGRRLLDDELAEKALARYKEERVLEILSNPMGVQTKVGSRPAAEMAASIGDAPRTFSVSRRALPIVDRAARIIPGSLRVSLSDGRDLASKLDYYAVQMNKGDDYRAELFQRIYEIDGQPGMEGAARNIITSMMDDLIDTGVQRVMETPWGSSNPDRAKFIGDKLRNSLQVWNREVGSNKAYYQFAQADGVVDIPHIVGANGDQIPMTNAHLEQEMANGNLFLPDPRAFYRITTKTGQYLESMPKTAKTYELLDRMFSDYWRSLVLIRPAYIVRNIAEMEIRNFLAGEVNAFSNPLQMAGMVFGGEWDSWIMRGASKALSPFDRYNHDIRGNQFLKRVNDDTDDEAEAYRGIHDRYLQIIDISGGSISDPRLYDIAATRGGMEAVGPGTARFNEGWALELMRLDRDTASRLVLRGRPDGKHDDMVQTFLANGYDETAAHQEAVMDWVYSSQEGAEWRERLARAGGESFQRLAEDPVAMRQYLFTWESSVQNRINDYTGNDPALLSFLRDRRLTDDNGDVLLEWPGGKTPDVVANNLRNVLAENFKDVNMATTLKVWVAPPSEQPGFAQKFVSGFFKIAANMERVAVMGPEYRYAYWKQIEELSDFLTVEAKREASQHVGSSLTNLTRNGSRFSDPDRMSRRIADETKAGPMSLADAHAIASDAAGDVVANLYYDATQRRNFFQATRLMMPFGQAWANSFSKWTELALKNPVQVYKAQRAMYAALEKDSSTIYDMMSTNPGEWGQDRDFSATNWYDPNQGLIQFDDFGEPVIYIPGVGTAMSALSGMLNRGETPTQMSGFRLKGLNLLTAGSDSPMPPVGPAVTIPAAQVMNRLTSNEFLYEYLFPYGEPTAADGIFEGIAPAWARRMLASFDSPDNQYRLANLKPAMAFLVQNGNFDLSSEAEKERFLDEATGMTRWMTFITAIGQAVLPTTPVSKYQFDQAGSGERVAATAVANLFYDQYLPGFGDDYEQAWEAFFSDFGVQGLVMLTSTTDSPVGGSIRDSAWEKMREYPDLALAYPEEMALLFPGGDRSITARQWQQERGDRTRKAPKDVLDDVYRSLYRLSRAGIDEKASQLRWPDERKAIEVERLDESFKATGKPGYEGGSDPASRIGKVEEFLRAEPVLAESPSGNAFVLAVNERDDILAEMNARGIDSKTMASKKAEPYRRRYFALLDALTVEVPDFSEAARLLRKEQS